MARNAYYPYDFEAHENLSHKQFSIWVYYFMDHAVYDTYQWCRSPMTQTLNIFVRNKNREDGEFDLGRKVREDPLAMVKEKENERFKKLQANPQKMARMKKLMMAYMGGQESSDSSSASEDDEPKRFERF